MSRLGWKSLILNHCQRILGIPFKRTQRSTVDYLELEEIKAILAAVDRSSDDGYRDYTLLFFMGHEDIQSTSIYLHLDLNRKREIQKRFIKYMQSVLTRDPKIEELLDWENKEDIITWLDSL